jgi:hypothetical protein
MRLALLAVFDLLTSKSRVMRLEMQVRGQVAAPASPRPQRSAFTNENHEMPMCSDIMRAL